MLGPAARQRFDGLSVSFQYRAKRLSVSFQISFQSIFSFISFSIKKAVWLTVSYCFCDK